MKILPVVLAGGFGKRLWPLSTNNKPKQFLKILGKYSSFQSASLNALMINSKIVISCNIALEELVREQLSEVNIDNYSLIFEDISCNTSIAIIASAFYAKNIAGYSKILVIPSDHVIEDVYLLKERSLGFLSVMDKIILFGIKPLWKERSYGYIVSNSDMRYSLYLKKVEKFIEKPDIDVIEDLLSRNCDIYWNSGIFLFPVDFLLEQVSGFSQNIISIIEKSYESAKITDKDIYLEFGDKENVPNISIDYLLLEQNIDLLVCELNISWRDIGSWKSLLEFFYDKYLSSNSYLEENNQFWGRELLIKAVDRLMVKLFIIDSGYNTEHKINDSFCTHYLVMHGKAEVAIEDKRLFLEAGSYFSIEQGDYIQFFNKNDEILQIIETQVTELLVEAN